MLGWWALTAAACGGLGGCISVQKRRGVPEGLALGLLLGPLGVLLAMFVPQGKGSRDTSRRRSINDLGNIASIADRFQAALEQADPDWEQLPYHAKRRLLRPIEKRLESELGLSPTELADFSAEARGLLFERANGLECYGDTT
jgi:hypothetical protein